jgi:hypothetical protein
LRLLRGGLNDAIGARRTVMVGVALGRVGVPRLGCEGRINGGCGLCLNRRGSVGVRVRMGMTVPVAMGMRRVIVDRALGRGGMCLGVG